jgi:LacI family transcriptional regulator
MTTIHDVARHAGVSAATVSRVLNGHRTVDETLAGRVRAAAEQLGYQPNILARNLRKSQTNLWAVIISDVNNPFFTSLVRGVEDVAQQAGYSVLLCNSDENPDKESSYVTAVLAQQIAGVIISPSTRSESIAQLVDGSRAVVTIDREVSDVDTDAVLVDNERGAQAATAHLIEQGYSRIACITGPNDVTTATSRLRGYRDALREAGRPYDDDLVRFSDFRETGGKQAMADLLDSGVRPDAIFATNNLMTVGALETLAERGVGVPDPIGVVGFDELPWADLVRPSLSTVAQPTYEVGRTAAQLLLKRLENPAEEYTTITLSTKLNVRDSSRR